jgi:hypothetical protein
MKKYDVYAHLNPITKDIFYIGIGFGNRAWNKWAGRNKFWENYVNKYGFEVDIIVDNITRKQAEKTEIDLIANLGRRQIDEGGVLVNRSSGGEGSVGYTHTEEYKIKLSNDRKGKCTRKQKTHSEETKQKISKKLKERHCKWGKPVLQMDLENNVIAEWYSITEAKKQTGAKTIWEVIKGKHKTSAGYKWKLKE